RRRHTRSDRDWSSDVCSSDLASLKQDAVAVYQPVNSQELFALEQLAISQQTTLRAARLEAGLFANCLESAITANDTPFGGWSPRSEERRVGEEGRNGRVCRDR